MLLNLQSVLKDSFLSFLSESLEDEVLDNNTTRQILKIHPFLAPYKAAVLPLMKKGTSRKSTRNLSQTSSRF